MVHLQIYYVCSYVLFLCVRMDLNWYYNLRRQLALVNCFLLFWKNQAMSVSDKYYWINFIKFIKSSNVWLLIMYNKC